MKSSPFFMLVSMVSIVSAQAISLSGTVSNSAGQPLQGVIVALIASHLADTTDAAGAYWLNGSVPVTNPAEGHARLGSVSYQNNMFIFTMASPAGVSVKLYDMLGARLTTVYSGYLGQGKTRVPFNLNGLGCSVYLMRIQNGTSIATCKINPLAIKSVFIPDPGTSGGPLQKTAASDWLQATKSGYASHLEQMAVLTGIKNITMSQASAAPDFGPNVYVFDPSLNTTTMQNQLNTLNNPQLGAQFGGNRYAFLFKPGSYSLDVNVGFYTEVLGLGTSPDSVQLTGQVHSEADWMNGNATCTFWKAMAGICVTPAGGLNRWAASQGAPVRRMHIKGNVALDDGGWSSGGFFADCKVDGSISSGSQQQYFSRNDVYGSWNGGNWNMTFVGTTGGPTSSTTVNRTVVTKTPVIAEKPFLVIDKSNNYSVLVPDLRRDSTSGVSWAGGATPGVQIPIDLFFVAKPADNAATINAALNQGKNLLLTPGHYNLDNTIMVNRPGTIVLGIGYPTLAPTNGTVCMKVADADGIRIGGILFEGTMQNSPVLLEVGDSGSTVSHSKNPVCLYDIFCRVGGQFNGLATCFIKINSNDVVFDHTWLWRADHGTGAGWNSNKNANGLVVNGNNVTMYGLFVEHTQEYQTWWNGNGGRTFFYQSEMPYDPPDQPSWMRGTINGYPSYKVSDRVTTHEAWGLGVYSVFRNNVISTNAFEVPANAPGVKMHHMVTQKLGGGEITHVINGVGGVASSSVLEYP
jgi:hypothetical protein